MTTSPQTPDAYRDEDVEKLADLISDAKVCMFTTTDEHGASVSRPMAVQEVEFDGDLWFFTSEDSAKVRQVQGNARVNVSFSSSSSWVSVSGDASVVRDSAKAKELWNAAVSAWFPDGPETPELVLLKVRATGAEYWDTPGTLTASLISFVKAHTTGEPGGGTENRTVDL